MAMREEESQYTIEDIMALPDGTRAELIDGRMYMMATPSYTHQMLAGELYHRIRNYIDNKGGECKALISPFAVFISNDDLNYLEPDISVICDRDKLDEKGCHGAPDWIIEIVSPSSKRMDEMIKLFKYKGAGVREYWTVDKEKDSIRVYNFEHEDIFEYTFMDKVKAGIYEDLEIDFEDVVRNI